MSYFLALLPLLGSVIFFGLPLPLTLLIAFKAEVSYMASFVIGLIFATNNLCKTAFLSIFRFSDLLIISAISLIVNPVMFLILIKILDFFKSYLMRGGIQEGLYE